MDFIEYCHHNKILLAIFPPHSTHTLQPLDVVLFKPLSSAYSRQLAWHQQRALGHLPIKKGDFFPLFWAAWIDSFKKSTVIKSFKATGIWPMNAEVVTKRFTHTDSDIDMELPDPSGFTRSDWIHLERLLRRVVRDKESDEAKELSAVVHHYQVHHDLLLHEVDGLQAALTTKKRRKKHGKPLPFQQKEDYHGGAALYSPRAVRVARERAVQKEQEEEEKQLQKLRRKKEQEEKRLEKQLELEQRRSERERAKVVREKERAEKAAERARQKQLQITKKSALKPQNTKRKASKVTPSSNKRQKRVVDGAASVKAQEVPSAAPPKLTSRGRAITLPKKFK